MAFIRSLSPVCIKAHRMSKNNNKKHEMYKLCLTTMSVFLFCEKKEKFSLPLILRALKPGSGKESAMVTCLGDGEDTIHHNHPVNYFNQLTGFVRFVNFDHMHHL